MKRKLTSILFSIILSVSAYGEASYDYLDEILVNGAAIEGFNPLFLEYDISIPYYPVPDVSANFGSPTAHIVVELPDSLPGTAVIELRERTSTINIYDVHFSTETELVLQPDLAGSAPTGLKVEGTGIKVAEAPDGAQSLLIGKASSAGKARVLGEFPKQTGIVVVEGNFLLPGGKPSISLLTIGNEAAGSQNPGAGGVAIALEARDGGIVYRTADGYEKLFEAYFEDRWTHLKVVADVEAGTVDVYVGHWNMLRDGKFLGETDGIDRFVTAASAGAEYHVKDLIVYRVVD